MKRLTEFWWQTASLIAPTPERDDDVDASVAGSLWILGVLGASMFALLFVAGLCYCVCPSAAFCDNDENKRIRLLRRQPYGAYLRTFSDVFVFDHRFGRGLLVLCDHWLRSFARNRRRVRFLLRREARDSGLSGRIWCLVMCFVRRLLVRTFWACTGLYGIGRLSATMFRTWGGRCLVRLLIGIRESVACR